MSHLLNDVFVSVISPWVERQTPHLKNLQGRALDLACGTGRHARFLHQLGFEVIAADRDPSGFDSLQLFSIDCVQCDFETSPEGFRWPFKEQSFAVVLVTNYLHRPLFPSILNSLQIGGILIYETFAEGHQALGRPRNPDFLLKPNELLRHCLPQAASTYQYECLAFEHGFVNRTNPAIVQSICARRIS